MTKTTIVQWLLLQLPRLRLNPGHQRLLLSTRRRKKVQKVTIAAVPDAPKKWTGSKRERSAEDGVRLLPRRQGRRHLTMIGIANITAVLRGERRPKSVGCSGEGPGGGVTSHLLLIMTHMKTKMVAIDDADTTEMSRNVPLRPSP
jgi:hypothetical protein